jgi:selenide, water dikinase
VAQVLRHVNSSGAAAPPDLLVGLAAPDDAAVYRLNDGQAIVTTVDFFAPLVDDPYAYGAIAAANAMSDVYAMGGEVILALNVAAFPEDMDPATIARILQGGADKVGEAGAVVAGGHTVLDDEPKFGLCAIGLVHPDGLLTKAGVQPGDILYLTKPLGTGIVTTAAMRDEASAEHLSAAIESMTRLNRHASHIALDAGAHALTDITGYSLLGHGYEMAAASGVSLRIEASSVPVLPGALEYAERGILTGGAGRNREYLADKVRMAEGIPEPLSHVLFDPQTSGGLLIAVPPERVSDIEARRTEHPLWRIGDAAEGHGIEVTA